MVEKLDAFPGFKRHIEELLRIASSGGPGPGIELADDAEGMILELSPKLNKAVLQGWAETQSQKKALDFANRHKGSRKDVKKK